VTVTVTVTVTVNVTVTVMPFRRFDVLRAVEFIMSQTAYPTFGRVNLNARCLRDSHLPA
jgi:hypothetical protein